MPLHMILTISWRALGRNKVRSLLTMLGIIIGVGAVITMVALGQGAQKSVQDSIASMGTNVLYLFSTGPRTQGVRQAAGQANLKNDDVQAIRRECPAVRYVTPIVRTGSQVIYGSQNVSTSVQGVNVDFFLIREWVTREGFIFSDMDVSSGAKVCVLGTQVRDQLFGSEDPIGKAVRIRNVPFRVVGVLESKGQSGFGSDQDDVVVIPYTTAQKRLVGREQVSAIMASATSSEAVSRARDQMTALMRQRHRIPDDEEPDFDVRTQQEVAQTAEQSTRIFTMLMAGIASVSLVVGGIGIMNIMLVSVTERIREIGIRMALGARPGDILSQFFVEALLLSFMGGGLGILLGYGASQALPRFLGFPTPISPGSVLLAFGCSAAVGIFFGFYPAWRASRLDPIEALRNE